MGSADFLVPAVRVCQECNRELILCKENFEPTRSNYRRVCRDCKNASDLARKMTDPTARQKHLTACRNYYYDNKKEK